MSQGGDKNTSFSQQKELKQGWKTIDLKMFEVKEENNSKKLSLIPSEEGAQIKGKKEKFICGSKCCRQNWVNKLIKAKMIGEPK